MMRRHRSWSTRMLHAGSVDKNYVKEVSYLPTRNLISWLFSFLFFFLLAIAMKHFCPDPSPLHCVCGSMWSIPSSVYSAAEKCNDFWAGCPKINLACGES